MKFNHKRGCCGFIAEIIKARICRFPRHLICMLVVVFFCAGILNAKYGGGSGIQAAPYLIFTADHLAQIGNEPNDWDKNFKLMNDIDLGNYNGANGNKSFPMIGFMQWVPYGSYPFRGVFDGNGKRIINLTISTGKDFVGLFQYVNGPNACIKNVKIVNPRIDAATAMYVGALVGKFKNGRITGCTVEGGNISGGDSVGGLVGYCANGTISKCSVNSNVSGKTDVGGITGYQTGKTISDCGFTGYVTGISDLGGIAGESDGYIENCFVNADIQASGDKAAGLTGTLRGQIKTSYARGKVSGRDEVGGFVGRNAGAISDCYSRVNISGNGYVGGLSGLLYSDGIITRCYAVGNIDTNDLAPGQLVGRCETQSIFSSFWPADDDQRDKMMLRSTYAIAGWQFYDESTGTMQAPWIICDGNSFPRLSWERRVIGDWQCPEGVDLYDIATLFEEWMIKTRFMDFAGGTRLAAGLVNFTDFSAFAAAWGTSPGMPRWNSMCDLSPENGNGVVDAWDLAAFTDSWLYYGISKANISDVIVTGDGLVNFIDWAVFARAWRSSRYSANWNSKCDVAPTGGDGVVDEKDLAVFTDEWVGTGGTFDIAPAGGDGLVNFIDFAAAAQNYLDPNL